MTITMTATDARSHACWFGRPSVARHVMRMVHAERGG